MTKTPRGVVLCTGSASSFRYLKANDPAFGVDYQIVGLIADNPGASGLTFAKEIGIPTKMLDFNHWRQESGVPLKDLKGREPYFVQMLAIIDEWDPDFIILCGYMSIITDPLLSAYAGKILNVHPAWLSIRNDDGSRRYTGNGVVARAMQAGDLTGSTVHFINEEPDLGPIVAESAPLPYDPWDDPEEHQAEMKSACDGPAYQEALRKLIAAGWPERPWIAP